VGVTWEYLSVTLFNRVDRASRRGEIVPPRMAWTIEAGENAEERRRLEDWLNWYGEQGWELVWMAPDADTRWNFVLKRQLPSS
jgi:hypothetical protein